MYRVKKLSLILHSAFYQKIFYHPGRMFSTIGVIRLGSCLTFLIGGAGSGKSAFAESLASGASRVVYIATAEAGDPEMASRIAAHRSRRPAEWRTWEGDVLSLPREIEKITSAADILLFDSLTMYVSTAMLALPGDTGGNRELWSAGGQITGWVRDIFAGFREAAVGTDKRLIAVSDEAGCGVVPAYPSGRRFRDLLGAANQLAAAAADEAAMVVAGLPLWLKARP